MARPLCRRPRGAASANRKRVQSAPPARRAEDRARKTVLTVAACFAPIGMVTTQFGVAGSIVIFSVVAVVCTTWLFNQTALLADVAPRESVASVHGVSGACGALGGLIFNAGIGPLVDAFGYAPVFVVAGTLHLIAAFILRGVQVATIVVR